MNNEMKRAVGHIEMPADMRRRILTNVKKEKKVQKLNIREIAALAASFIIFISSVFYFSTTIIEINSNRSLEQIMMFFPTVELPKLMDSLESTIVGQAE